MFNELFEPNFRGGLFSGGLIEIETTYYSFDSGNTYILHINFGNSTTKNGAGGNGGLIFKRFIGN